MSRRVAIGKFGSDFDVRIARRGFDAVTDDVNDYKKISFAASRATFGQMAEVGSIYALDTWAYFSIAYTQIPAVVLVVNRSGTLSYIPSGRIQWSPGAGTTYTRDGTHYVGVVELTRMLVTRPYTAGYPAGISAGDSFFYFVVA